MKQSGRIDLAHVIQILALVALLSITAGLSVAQDTPGVDFVDGTFAFDWLDAGPDTATFAWSVELANDTDRAYEVRVILELLDDDDQVVNRDDSGAPVDIVTITIDAHSRQAVQATGELPYDVAAGVVSMRHRRELVNSNPR